MVHPRYRSFLQAGYLWGRYDHRPSTSRGCMAVVPLSWASPAGCGRGSGGPDYRPRAARRRAARARRSSVYVLATCAFCPPALTVRATQIPGTRTCKAGATQTRARKTLRFREMQAHVEPLQHHARNGLIPHSAATAHRGDCAPTAGCAATRTVRSTLSGSRTSRNRSGRVWPVAHAVRTHWPVVRPLEVGALERRLTLIRGSKGGFMRRVAGVIACAVVVRLVLPSQLAAQGGIIWGRVADTTGALLARATVSVEATGGRTTSNDQGNYEIRRVPAGTHTVRVRLLGYVAQTVRIAVSEEQTVRQDFSLRRQPIGLAPVDVVVGSRARHTGAEELAVPVDVYAAEALAQQGTSETSQILQALAASVNFPRQSVTDANDIVRPFTLRGLSPDHTLVLLNGWRRHQTALVNNFAYGMAAGSSGVDLNAIPVSAIDRIEVLRDSASAQYGSDAIAGVVNIVTKEGQFTPVVNVDGGRYVTDDYPDDGTTVDVNGGWGIGLGRGSLALFGEFLDRQPTNQAWADPFETSVTGLPDSIDNQRRVALKRYPAAGGWRGRTGGWGADVGGSLGHNHFDYGLRNTLNVSLGPCLDPAAPCAPAGIPNQTSFFAGRLVREEFIAAANVAKSLNVGLPAPIHLAVGAEFRRERYQIVQGELSSYIDGGDTTQFGGPAVAGSQGFPGFTPSDASDHHRTNFAVYTDAETELSQRLLVNLAGRFEIYSDVGARVTGKLALRYQPWKRLTLRGSASTGFRAPGLSQEYFTNGLDTRS